MATRTRSRPALAALLGAGALTALTAAHAVALPSAPVVGASTGPATNATEAAFGWTASTPDEGATIVRYEAGFAGALTSYGPDARFAGPVPLGDEGEYVWQVRAVQTDAAGVEEAGPAGSVRLLVDRTAPRISVALSPRTPNGDNGWYRVISASNRLVIDWTCGDAGGSGIAHCPEDEVVTTQGADQRRSGRARDAAGNLSGVVTTPAFDFDAAAPPTGVARAPTPGARLAAEPLFVWSPSTGRETSGVNRYEIMLNTDGVYRAVASARHVPGRAQYEARRDPALRAAPFPEGVPLRWYVRTIDNAGNSGGGVGQSRTFMLDSTAPPAPEITAGPAGATNANAPTFRWLGQQRRFDWAVYPSGTETAVQAGAGEATSVTLQPLADGDYTFRVAAVSDFGAESVEASRPFVVDTVAPPTPTITSRPPSPSPDATPSFAWTTEPGATSRWTARDGAGAAIQSSDTPLPSATLATLAAGTYTFGVQQIDAAGNLSPVASEAFTISGATTGGVRRVLPMLPQLNASKLKPKLGSTVRTLTPALRWARGPRGTTLFNVQVFRVQQRHADGTLSLKKVVSIFPKRRVVKMPKRRLTASSCYVWRVWPYVGNRFAPKALGVSHFCTARAGVIRRAKTDPARGGGARR